MRIYFYILAGVMSALIGWNLGQFFIADLGILLRFPEIILFPCVAISLAVGMVLNEIFLSTPTRTKLNLRVARFPICTAVSLGLLAGLISGGISQILFLPQLAIPTFIVRIVGWLLIGSSVGISEGLTWRRYSIEAGDQHRFRKRFKISVIAGSIASFTAALMFELLRLAIGELPESVRNLEDPIGFSLLGALLGLAFSLSTSPSYMAALRAGTGFEYTEIYGNDVKHQSNYPSINQTLLKFVSDSEADQIEEGLSIQLPASGKLSIGSASESDVFIPDLPSHVAYLEILHREAKLFPDKQYFNQIQVNGISLTSSKPVNLKHNYILTFYANNSKRFDSKSIFRFVYYNRFLDPQA